MDRLTTRRICCRRYGSDTARTCSAVGGSLFELREELAFLGDERPRARRVSLFPFFLLVRYSLLVFEAPASLSLLTVDLQVNSSAAFNVPCPSATSAELSFARSPSPAPRPFLLGLQR